MFYISVTVESSITTIDIAQSSIMIIDITHTLQ
jgi:hypothetical protein